MMMGITHYTLRIAISLLSAVLLMAGVSDRAGAHCDAINGPVAAAAQEALSAGRFETVAIWVGEAQEEELREKFEQCSAVYKRDGDAKKLAERYFMEIAVRLHREAEGFSYTGLKPAAPLPPDVAAAEKSLEAGNVTIVTDLLASELRYKTEELFEEAIKARTHKDENIDAGRKWVNAYVRYVIYVHGLHKTIQTGPAHGIGDQ